MTDVDPRRRRAWPFVGGVVVLLAVLPLSYAYFFRAPPPRAAPAVAPTGPVELRLGELHGAVEVRRGGAWVTATPGDVLKPSDGVRTHDGAYALLVGGQAYEVRMEAGTEVSVGELTSSISKLLLATGMATARVRGGARHVFEVRSAGSDAVARTDNGTFAVSNNGQGTVAVGSLEGQVEVLGKGRTVIVRAGQRSLVLPGQAPLDPTPIPSSLLLKVQWPDGAVNRRKLVLSGQSEPGTLVQVGGARVPVDATGAFRTALDLKEGRNTVVVHAQSVGSTSQDVRHGVYVDTQADRIRVDKDLWKR